VEVVASLSQGRTAAAQCGLFTHKSVPVIFEPPCILFISNSFAIHQNLSNPRPVTKHYGHHCVKIYRMEVQGKADGSDSIRDTKFHECQ